MAAQVPGVDERAERVEVRAGGLREHEEALLDRRPRGRGRVGRLTCAGIRTGLVRIATKYAPHQLYVEMKKDWEDCSPSCARSQAVHATFVGPAQVHCTFCGSIVSSRFDPEGPLRRADTARTFRKQRDEVAAVGDDCVREGEG